MPARILDFEHDRVKVLKYRGSTKRRRVVVKTTVDLENGDNVSVNYMLIRNDSGWMMFDVIIEGVSFVQSFSVEFGEEIRATSLETVISRLETKVNGAAGE